MRMHGRIQAQGHALQILFQGGVTGRFPHFLVREEVVSEEDVVPDGAFYQLAVLQADADAVAPQAGLVDVVEVVLVEEDGAALRLLESQHQAHQGGFAAARRAYQGHIVARIDLQVEVVEKSMLPLTSLMKTEPSSVSGCASRMGLHNLISGASWARSLVMRWNCWMASVAMVSTLQ